MKNLSRFESVQRPSVAGFLIVLEIVIGPINSSLSDTLQIKPLHARTRAEFLCQFCAISLQKQAIFREMWQQ